MFRFLRGIIKLRRGCDFEFYISNKILNYLCESGENFKVVF